MADGLLEGAAAADPVEQFDRWYGDARASGTYQPEAMVVATVDLEGRPSCRFVLLREHGPEGFVFYTDHESDKGRDLTADDRVALLFPWQELSRQVRVTGAARRVDEARSDAYWAGRPRGSRLASVASHQSRPIADRAELEATYERVAARYPEGVEVPRPARWAGFLVVPVEVEFWQGREHRFHDRLRYRRVGASWVRERLQP